MPGFHNLAINTIVELELMLMGLLWPWETTYILWWKWKYSQVETKGRYEY